ncbi:MAG: hypothetical protein FE046_03535 [Thermoplasmata archaeon]|nr:MAG: hypothetical protein FE046_03535 [Thermoplasmata archaeon]
MVKRDYIADIEKSLKEGKKPIEVLNVILGFLNFKSVEIRIYKSLAEKITDYKATRRTSESFGAHNTKIYKKTG